MRDVNVYWRAAYAGKKELTSGAAREALKPYDKQLLALLGKASPKPDDYQRLSNAIVTTFADDTDDRYRLATRKETQQSLPPGTVWWLYRVQSEKLIVPEDKSGDDRLKDCSKDHIVRVTDWFTSNIHVRDRAWDEL